ncbi:hypothetical protein [Campylobacter lanienae]|nr:hypothetical protein [Campylobacter lanienae]
MGYPTKWGFSVCYFSTDFVRALKVGKNKKRGIPIKIRGEATH